MILIPYQVYLLEKEYEMNTIKKGRRNKQIRTILDTSVIKMDYCSNQIEVGTTFGVTFFEDGEFFEEEVYTLVENIILNESVEDGIISLNSPFGVSVYRKRTGEICSSETETGLLLIGMISKIYSKEEHQEFMKGLKEKVKTLGSK